MSPLRRFSCLVVMIFFRRCLRDAPDEARLSVRMMSHVSAYDLVGRVIADYSGLYSWGN